MLLEVGRDLWDRRVGITGISNFATARPADPPASDQSSAIPVGDFSRRFVSFAEAGSMCAAPMLGVIFDWDGVILDSGKFHELSWESLAREEKRELPLGHFRAGFGKKNEIIIPEMLRWSTDPVEVRRLSLRKEALYREILQERGIAPLPGVEVFLDRLLADGIPTCIGSSTHRENIEVILELMNWRDRFGGMVTSEDVSRGKPDPEVFLRAAAKTGCPPSGCVVFEDALVGLQAARAGGMKTVGVATTHPAHELTAFADRVVSRLDELTVAELRTLVSV